MRFILFVAILCGIQYSVSKPEKTNAISDIAYFQKIDTIVHINQHDNGHD